jgi:hypothetical protein
MSYYYNNTSNFFSYYATKLFSPFYLPTNVPMVHTQVLLYALNSGEKERADIIKEYFNTRLTNKHDGWKIVDLKISKQYDPDSSVSSETTENNNKVQYNCKFHWNIEAYARIKDNTSENTWMYKLETVAGLYRLVVKDSYSVEVRFTKLNFKSDGEQEKKGKLEDILKEILLAETIPIPLKQT